jgi:hypothetical protein
MKILIFTFCLVTFFAQAQDSETLTKSFNTIKDKAQTFKDYKVIKQTTLDAFWKSVEDSLAKQRLAITQQQTEINSFNARMDQQNVEIARREAAAAEMEFDSEHITVAGIAMHKAAFISVFFISLAVLAGLLILSFIRSQLLSRSLKEKAETMLILTSEFEEYKHRALEKQMKISRELQDERNRMAEVRTNR